MGLAMTQCGYCVEQTAGDDWSVFFVVEAFWDFLGGFCATVWCPICLHWEETCRIESAASLDGLQRVRPKLRDHSPGQFSSCPFFNVVFNGRN
ncbi:uncharacterized protein LOC144036113 isoform X2 [Vanacampus margaritifer]